MGFRFLGDGVSNTSALADGVYLLSLKVSTAGLTDSDPFYFVLPKGVSPERGGRKRRLRSPAARHWRRRHPGDDGDS